MHPTGNWSNLGGLLFAARRLVDGLYAGAHLSPQPGPGIDFHDYRAYSPGDDLADVDWKLFGRTDRYYVRRYRRQTDLSAYLLLDVSASMGFSALDRRGRPVAEQTAASKLHYAQTLAALIATLMIRQGDRVGLGMFADRLVHHLTPGSTPAHLQQICADLERAQPAGRADPGAALVQAHAQMKRRGLFIIISDLLDDPQSLFDGLGRLRHDRFEATVLQVLSGQELNLRELGGELELVDTETRRSVQTDIGQVRRRYEQLMSAHLIAVSAGCRSRGMDYHLLRTDQPIIEGLRAYLVKRNATVAR